MTGKRLLIMVFAFLMAMPVYAVQQDYRMDRHDGNWTAFHYANVNDAHVNSCFVLSNTLSLGFRSDAQNVGLVIWDAKGSQKPGTDKKVAITIGKEHFLFIMMAMDKNMMMNRLEPRDFRTLLSKLSYADMAIVEYGQQPVDIVDLSGLPSVLGSFRQCIMKAGFKGYE